jgi:DNA processing protein
MDEQNLKALLLLNRVTNYTPVQKFALLKKFGSAKAAFTEREKAEGLFQKPFKSGGSPLDTKRGQESVEEEFDFYMQNGIEMLDISDDRYPTRLKNIYDPPVVLFARGNLALLQNGCPVSMVGSRRASNASIALGYSIARELAGAGALLVSGLAAGVDFYIHKGALDEGGGTVAVLDVVYPRENAPMYKRIGSEGLILTEFSLGIPPYKRNFPMRNRIISGLVLGVVVVEASERSGALITAMYALEQGRELMALPGRASSEYFAGNNRLIKDGAHLVENARDVLSVLGWEYDGGRKEEAGFFSSLEQDILRVIGDDLVSIEEIEIAMGGPVAKIASALMMLELKNAIVQHPGKIFSRVQKYGY